MGRRSYFTFNQQSKDVLFGGKEVELFSGHSQVLTMQLLKMTNVQFCHPTIRCSDGWEWL